MSCIVIRGAVLGCCDGNYVDAISALASQLSESLLFFDCPLPLVSIRAQVVGLRDWHRSWAWVTGMTEALPVAQSKIEQIGNVLACAVKATT